MRKTAVIDIGTNSIKLYVAGMCPDGTVKTIDDRSSVTRLGERLGETGNIPQDVLERNALAVAEFVDEAKSYDADNITCIGTEALREAANSGDFAARVKELCGEDIRIISGKEEAAYSYLAVMSLPGMGDMSKETVIFDTGGGSTEFIFAKAGGILDRFSVNVGAVKVTERFFADDPVAEGSVTAALKFIDGEFDQAGVTGSPDKVVGIGGGVTNMASVKLSLAEYDRKKVRGVFLTEKDIDDQIEMYVSKTIEERKKITGLAPARADVILAGACIIKNITERFGADGITVSDRGARHGLALELLGAASL